MTVDINAESRMRPLWRAIRNGMLCRCPRCGEGKLFRAYLKVRDTCTVCRQELHHHRADDMPPYIAIFIVGHLLVGVMLHFEMSTPVHPMVYVWTMVPMALLLPPALLPAIKGGVVGLQWAQRMHGFDPRQRDPALPDETLPPTGRQ